MPPFATPAHGALAWHDVQGDEETCEGKVALADERGNDYLVLDFYCYFLPLPEHRAVLWHAENGEAMPAAMRFTIIDLDRLQKVDAAETCKAMARSKNKAAFAAGEVSSVAVPSSLPVGVNAVAFPPEFRTLRELLVLVDSTAAVPSDFFQTMNLCLWSVQPSIGRIEVFPQDWFNRGPYDFGYQWVTRVAREPDTNRVVGEGVRLRPFRLDSSLRNVETWLEADDLEPTS